MLKVLIRFEIELQDKYWNNRSNKHDEVTIGHGYLENVRTSKAINHFLRTMTDDELRALVAKSDGSIVLFADGPFGDFSEPSEIGLFKELAAAAPDAAFSGRIEGIAWGEEIAYCGTFSNGRLELDNNSNNDYIEEECFDEEDYDETPAATFSIFSDENQTKLNLKLGDHVIHTTYGKGEVKRIKKAGKDTLLTVFFENDFRTEILLVSRNRAYLRKL